MKGKRLFKVIIMLFLCVFALPSNYTDVEADEMVEDFYIYPLTVDSENWFDYTVKEKSEMLKIDETILSNMSDRQLVYAIADYPYLCDIYLYGVSISDGIDQVKQYCSALGELSKRTSFHESLEKYGTEIINRCIEETSDWKRFNCLEAMNDLIEFSKGNCSHLHESTDNKEYNSTKAAPTVPYYLYPEDHTANQHLYWDYNQVLNVYNIISYDRIGSCRYNCHSYAWYSQLATNIYWIPDPTGYTTSGNYSQLYGGNVSSSIYTIGMSVGDIIFYQSGNTSTMHSVLFVGNPSNGAPLADATVQSKWGSYGVFTHRLTEVPVGYDYTYISIWH